jgi:nucleotide-binding universal stress UspA family protein
MMASPNRSLATAPGTATDVGPTETGKLMAVTEFRIGAHVQCDDGACGHVSEVIVDTRTWTVTHLVVEPPHRSGLGRLVPLDLADAVADEIQLRCTLATFEQFGHAEKTELLPGSNGGYGGYGLGQAVPGPYIGRSSFGVIGGGITDAFDPVVHDTLPPGEIAVRGATVHATDGDIGHVQGFGVDRRDRRLAYVLLREGHLWGRKQVAVPIGAVTGIDDGIRLNITKQQVEDLPPFDVDGPPGEPVVGSMTATGPALPVTGDLPRRLTPSSRAGGAVDAPPAPTPVIVVGVDGSDASKDALRWAAHQAEVTGSALVAVSSWKFPAMAYGAVVPLPYDFDVEGASQKTLDQAISETLGNHSAVDVSTVVAEGPPALELLKAAQNADLLVVGSRGHGAFAGMLLGSVSEHCVAHSPCPVVVVRHGVPTA